jgi:glycine cleavage system transcriptional repressor
VGLTGRAVHVAVTAIGADRPGIVAAVTSVLVGREANIEDSSMTILRGRFAMVLVVTVPDGADAAALESELRDATADLGLAVHVEPVGESADDPVEGTSWSLSVYGADRPGIVHRVASSLAELGVNVTDLTTRVVGEESRPVYVMLLSLTVPPEVEVASVRERLGEATGDLGVECNLHPAESDIL